MDRFSWNFAYKDLTILEFNYVLWFIHTHYNVNLYVQVAMSMRTALEFVLSYNLKYVWFISPYSFRVITCDSSHPIIRIRILVICIYKRYKWLESFIKLYKLICWIYKEIHLSKKGRPTTRMYIQLFSDYFKVRMRFTLILFFVQMLCYGMLKFSMLSMNMIISMILK